MSADNLDVASDREELERQISARIRKPEGPQPTGRCLWCDEILGDYHRWCDAGCRDMWERSK
jgi:hypothetical protein